MKVATGVIDSDSEQWKARPILNMLKLRTLRDDNFT